MWCQHCKFSTNIKTELRMLIFIFSMCVTADLTGGHLSRDKPLFVKSFNQLRLTERAAFCLFLNCGNISSSRERERERERRREGEKCIQMISFLLWRELLWAFIGTALNQIKDWIQTCEWHDKGREKCWRWLIINTRIDSGIDSWFVNLMFAFQ